MALKRIDSVMALKRTLSHRCVFTAHCYQPSHNGVIRPNHFHAEKPNYSSFLHQRSFGSSIISQHLRSSSHLSDLCTPFGVSTYHRSMSTAHVPGSDENDVTGPLTDSVLPDDVSSQTTTGIKSSYEAAMDSLADVVQQIIGNVHSFTGLNWWASIVLSTLLIRVLTVPLLIHTEKFRAKIMMLVTELITIVGIKDQGGDSAALAKRLGELQKLMNKFGGVYLLSPLLLILQNPVLVAMWLAINNMTEKEASFKTGGAIWFTDLTTPDASYIFPFLTGLTYWIAVECDAVVGYEGVAFIFRKQFRYGVIPVVLLGMYLSKAVHCCLMSSMLFSIAFIEAIRSPGVRKQLGVPHVPEYLGLMSFKRIYKMNVREAKIIIERKNK